MIKDIFGVSVDLGKINKKNIKIDVGCDMAAPHASSWLARDDGAFVIAIEPNKENLTSLSKGHGSARDLSGGNAPYLRSSTQEILKRGEVIHRYNPDNFVLLPIAIDQVEKPTRKTFYSFSGSHSALSSLCEPTITITENATHGPEEITCSSLEHILDELELQDAEVIGVVKTDCQGSDLAVIKSLGKYLQKVRLIKSEWSTGTAYNTCDSADHNAEKLERFLNSHAFQLTYFDDTDVIFHNSHCPILNADFKVFYERQTKGQKKSNLLDLPSRQFNDLLPGGSIQ